MITEVRDLDRARAAELARAGEHDAAVRILDRLGDDPSTLDLLARVHAQRGDLAAAGTAWSAVLAQDPANPSALAGTRLIAEITSGKRRRHPIPRTVVLGSLALATLALAGALISVPRAEEPPVPPAPATHPVAAVPDPRQEQLRSLLTGLASPDVRLEQQDGGVRVVFRQGMFGPDSTDLTAAGRDQLQRWGGLLRGARVRVTVLGHGVVVPGGPTAGGSPTAVARAAAAVEVLAEISGQPATAFVVRSADQAEAPHSSADPAMNRTVSLVVTPS